MTSTPRFANVEIRIREGKGLRVDLRLNGEQEWENRALDTRQFKPEEAQEEEQRGLSIEQLEKHGWVHSSSAEEDGQRLFKMLFDELSDAWGYIRKFDNRRVRLRIDLDVPLLHLLPWEQLRELGGKDKIPLAIAASSATPFSRYIPAESPHGKPVFRRPLKVVLAVASPEDLPDGMTKIDVDREVELFKEATKSDEVVVEEVPQPCTLLAIEEKLWAGDGSHVLHLVCHGEFGKTRGSRLYLADKDNKTDRVDGDLFLGMFGRHTDAEHKNRLSLVFLCACESAKGSTADALAAVAPRLIKQGLPAVVAMQDKVGFDTAHEFVAAFYRQLLVHGLVDLAANEARSALLTGGDTEGASDPVVYMRLREGDLLGVRGRMEGEPGEFWPALKEYITEPGLQCLPFLGPRFSEDYLASRVLVMEQLADKCKYQLENRRDGDLARIAQYSSALEVPRLVRRRYLAILKEGLIRKLGLEYSDELEEKYAEKSLLETAEDLEWSDRVRELEGGTPVPHLLAELEFPLYVTTSPDPLMYLALKAQAAVEEARQVEPEWDANVPQGGIAALNATAKKPVVFHLCGLGANPSDPNIVLSEDQYLELLVRLGNTTKRESALPSDLESALSHSSFLFLGFDLRDWEFRLLLHGLINPNAVQREEQVNVGVQLQPHVAGNTDAAVKYLKKYLAKNLQLQVYWGDTKQFVGELHERVKGKWEPKDES